MNRLLPFTVCLAAVATSAHAQNTANAIAEARDAYGYRSGDESIGIYDDKRVRGFNLEAAGAFRLNEYYFARSGGTNSPAMQRVEVLVGLNATDTAFPSPSGLVNHQIRRPGDTKTSLTLGVETFNRPRAELIGSLESPSGALGAVIAGWVTPDDRTAQGGGGKSHLWAVAPRAEFAAGRALQLIAVQYVYDRDATARFAPGGAQMPNLPRGRYLSQDWAHEKGEAWLAGAIYEHAVDDRLDLGGSVVLSQAHPRSSFTHIFSQVAGDGGALSRIIAAPEQDTRSISGETRLRWRPPGLFRQELTLSLRGRDTLARLGGETIIDLGRTNLLVEQNRHPRPDLGDLQARDENHIEQWTLGASYGLRLASGVSGAFGAQHTRYEMSARRGGQADAESAAAWLYSASLSAPLGRRVVAYGVLARGLEEAGVAPATAANRNSVLAPILSEQREVGLRAVIDKRSRLFLTAFDISKPYLGLDAGTGLYGVTGEVRHTGLEASLLTRPLPGLSVLAGGYLMETVVSGPLVEAGRLAARPVGVPRTRAVLGLNYAIAQAPGLSLDLKLERNGDQIVRSSARPQMTLPPTTLVDLGFRYEFKAGGRAMTVRGQLLNAFDEYAWAVNNSETLAYIEPRRWRLLFSTAL